MQQLPSEFRIRLEQQLIAWELPAEFAAEIEEHSVPVTFRKGSGCIFPGSRGGSSLLASEGVRKALFASC